MGVTFHGSPIVVGVIPGHDEVWLRAAEMAISLSAHLICAYVDPSSYLIEWTPGRVPVLPLSLDPVAADDESAAFLARFTAHLQLTLDVTGVSWSFRRLAGDPVLALSRLAASVGASMLVAGSKRSGLISRTEEILNGSVSLRLMGGQERPVLGVPLVRTKRGHG